MKQIIIAAAFFATFGAIAGPFGVSKGMSLEELKTQGAFVATNQQFVYRAETIKNGHPDFEAYTAVLTPNQGLCKIQATGNDIETSGFGTELKSKYQSLIGAMSEKYGAPSNNFDFLRNGSLWTEPQYWMMGLLKKDRTLTAFWRKSEKNNLPDSLHTIMIETIALSGSKGYMRLAYEFDNIDACMAALQAKKNSNL